MFVFFAVTEAGIWLIKKINCPYMEDPVINRPVRGVASNEAEEAVPPHFSVQERAHALAI